MSIWGVADSSIPDIADYFIKPIVLTVTYMGTNITEFVKGFQISGSRGNQISGSLTLKDYTGELAEIISQFNPSNVNIRDHDMTDERVISIIAKQGADGPETEYPVLIPSIPTWDNDAECTFNFTDMTPLINKENVSGPDVVRLEGDTDSCHDVIDDIEVLAGVTIMPAFADYDINVFRMNATSILAALDDLQAPKQAYRKWIGDQLKLEVLTPTSASYSIIERKHIPDGGATLTKDTGNLRTYFKYIKNAPLSSALSSPVECTGKLFEESPCVGRVVQINFNRPAQYARILTEAQFGVIGEGVFFDADDNELNTLEAPQTEFYKDPLGEPAVRWLGTYTPMFEVGPEVAFVPSWRVKAIGGAYNETVSTPFEVEETVTEAETLYGERPEFKDLSTELLLNEADAAIMLAAIEEEVKWGINRINITTPWLFPAREGEFINVTHYRLGLNNEQCLLNGWSHSYTIEGGWNNSYDLSYEI